MTNRRRSPGGMPRLLRWVGAGTACLALAVGAACGGEAVDGILPIDPDGVAAITLTPDSLVVDGAGETVTFDAAVEDAEGDPVPDAELTWASSDLDVATVDQAGIATTLGPGETLITARSGTVADTASLIVAPVVEPPL